MNSLRLIIVFISLIAVSGGGLFLFLPKYHDYQSLRAEEAGKENELARKEEYYDQLEKLSLEIENNQEAIDKINYALAKIRACLHFSI